jgi:hypothetical protein
MTQVVLVRQIASQPWCLLLWRISNESKARPRQCNCSARLERLGASTRLAIEMSRLMMVPRGSLPAKQESVEEEIYRRSGPIQRRTGKQHRGVRAEAITVRPSKGKQEIDHKKG